MKQVYLDHASSTPIDPKVLEKMYEYDKQFFANPSSLYTSGANARKRLEAERAHLAHLLQAKPSEIYFTGSGTESDVLALRGIVSSFKKKHPGLLPHIIVSSIEHSAVLETARNLEAEGVLVTYIKPNKNGIVAVQDLASAITAQTILVSIMYVNNEIGTIQPVLKIAKLIGKYRKENKTLYPYFHTDVCQAVNYELITAPRLKADLISFNASKIYGPKGIGVLYVARTVAIDPVITGGGQERGLRSGTEALSLIIGIVESFELAQDRREIESKRLRKIQDLFLKEIENRFPQMVLRGDRKLRVPNNISITIPEIEAEELVIRLAVRGIEVSSKSACSSAQTDGSYVIMSTGGTEADSRQTLRITTGRSTTQDDMTYLLTTLEYLLKQYTK